MMNYLRTEEPSMTLSHQTKVLFLLLVPAVEDLAVALVEVVQLDPEAFQTQMVGA
jgi:hypothetical protein